MTDVFLDDDQVGPGPRARKLAHPTVAGGAYRIVDTGKPLPTAFAGRRGVDPATRRAPAALASIGKEQPDRALAVMIAMRI